MNSARPANAVLAAAAAESMPHSSIVEMSRDALIAVGADGRIVFWNAGARRMFLYDSEEALGCHCAALLGFGPSDDYSAALLHVMEAGHWEGELTGQKKDGTPVAVLSRWMLERDAGGAPLRILMANTDVRLWSRVLMNASRSWQRNFDVLFEQHPDGVAAFDHDGNLVSSNAALSVLTGYTRGELAGMALESLVDVANAGAIRDAFVAARGGAPQTCEFICRRKDRSELDASISFLPNLLAHRVVGVHGFIKDIGERKRNESRILYLANHDALTGLPNRNLLHDRLQHALEQAARTGKGMAVLFMDLNRFKIINDSLGHDKGDLLLCEVARRLRGALRDVDTVARLGGDEFVVILENTQEPERVMQVALGLLRVVAKPAQVDGHVLSVTTSIGASVYPRDGQDPFTLLKNADLAMYAAKEAAEGTMRFYEPAMNDNALARLQKENSLRAAVEQGGLVLHYQPRLDLTRGAIAGIEALVRWDHPRKGLIYPSHFIEVAEETGLIDALGAWVLKQACRQLKAWLDNGMAPIKVSVNISPLQLQSGRLAAVVEQALAASGLSPEHLELEITESSLMQNIDASTRALGDFQKMGISLSIDDFGTGYSSLSYLKRLPIDTLKIDKSFIRDLVHDEDDATIVSATIAMAHKMQLRVVAEGVISFEQMRFLERFHCDEIQGYLLCQPLPADEMETYLRTCSLRGIQCRWMH